MKKIYLVILIVLSFVTIFKTSNTLHSQTTSAVTKHPTLTGDRTQDDIPFSVGSDHIYNITGNLNISNNPAGSQTGVVFVDGNLNFTSNYIYGTNLTGTIFVVQGDINIDTAVTIIDAVLISEGTIYTAGSNCNTNSAVANQLVINGSLISLKQPPDTEPNAVYIKFCRKLEETGALKDSTDPAEKINHQVKYLVILRDLLSDTYQKWSEITGDIVLPTPAPTLTPTTTPTPSPN